MPYPQLVLDGVQELIDGESQRSEKLFHWLVSLEWIWLKDGKHLSLEGKLPSVPILGVG